MPLALENNGSSVNNGQTGEWKWRFQRTSLLLGQSGQRVISVQSQNVCQKTVNLCITQVFRIIRFSFIDFHIYWVMWKRSCVCFALIECCMDWLFGIFFYFSVLSTSDTSNQSRTDMFSVWIRWDWDQCTSYSCSVKEIKVIW